MITTTYDVTSSILPTDSVSSPVKISCSGSLGCHGKYLELNTGFLIRGHWFHRLLGTFILGSLGASFAVCRDEIFAGKIVNMAVLS